MKKKNKKKIIIIKNNQKLLNHDYHILRKLQFNKNYIYNIY